MLAPSSRSGFDEMPVSRQGQRGVVRGSVGVISDALAILLGNDGLAILLGNDALACLLISCCQSGPDGGHLHVSAGPVGGTALAARRTVSSSRVSISNTRRPALHQTNGGGSSGRRSR